MVMKGKLLCCVDGGSRIELLQAMGVRACLMTQ